MRYSVEERWRTKGHIKFGLFVNGGYAGDVTLKLEEFEDFKKKLGME